MAALFTGTVALEQAIVRNPLTVTPNTLVTDAIAHMSDARRTCLIQQEPLLDRETLAPEVCSSCVLIVENHQLLGIFTERDVVRLQAQGQTLIGKTVAEVTPYPAISLQQSELTDLFVALNLFQQQQICHLPLVDENRQVVGLLTQEGLRHLLRPIDLLRLRLVSEVMTPEVVCAPPDTSVQTLVYLLSDHQVSSVVIVAPAEAEALTQSEGSLPIGLVTEHDIVQAYALGLDFERVQAQAVMRRSVFSVHINDSLWVAHNRMQEQRLNQVVVTGDHGDLLGIVTQTTLLHALKPTEIHQLVETLEERLAHLQAEKLELRKNHNLDLEQQVQQRPTELRKQTERENLLRKIATQIRASFNLQETLTTVVTEVRQFLACDRAVVYQFNSDGSGIITAESATPEWPPILGQVIDAPCFQPDAKNLYQAGGKQAIPNIYRAGYSDCYLETLGRLQVKAHLVVPILVKNRPWGLLIGQQCSAPRNWDSTELELLDSIAVLVAIAIQQAELYKQSQAELHKRQQREQELQLLYTLTQSISLVEDVETALSVILAQVCESMQWAYGEVWMPTPDQTALGLGPSWCSNSPSLTAFKDISETLQFAAKDGLPGRVWMTQQPEWISNILELSLDQFPRLEAARRCGIKGAFGIPVLAEGGVIAVLCFYVKEVREINAFLLQLTCSISAQLGQIVRRKQSEKAFQSLVEGATALAGESFFAEVVRSIAQVLDVRSVMVATLRNNCLESAAFWVDGHLQPGITYSIDNTPCHLAITEGEHCCVNHVRQQFPTHQLLTALEAETYLGVALINTQGKTIGCLSVVDSKPLLQPHKTIAMLHVFAVRVSAELERQATMDALKQLNQELESRIEQRTIDFCNSEARFRRLFEQSPIGIAVSNLEGQITRVNASLRQILGYSEAELLQSSVQDLLAGPSASRGKQWLQEMQERTLSTTSQEEQLVSKQKGIVWATLTSALILDAFGRPTDIVHLIEDIGQRKQAEVKLTRYAQELEDLYNNAPCGYHSLDDAGRFVKINDTELNWLGYAREEVIGKPFPDFLSPQSQKIFTENHPQFLQQGWVKDIELELVSKTGYLFPVLLNTIAVKDVNGAYLCSRATTFDMRDRKQSEITLQKLSERLEMALKSAEIGIWEWDIDHDQMIWDGRMYDLYAIEPTALPITYSRWLELLHPEDRPIIEGLSQKNDLTHQDFEVEFRIILPEGTIRVIKSCGLIQRNQQGEMQRIVGINFDISKRKQVELALQESEEKFRQLAENIDGVFWVRDITGQILYISPAYETIWQRSTTNLYQDPTSWLEALHPEDYERMVLNVQQHTTFDEEYRIVLPNGQVRWIRDRGFAVRNQQGQIYRFAGIAEDISSHKDSEVERQAAEEALQSQLAAIEAAIDGIAVLAGDTYTYLNRAHLELFGYTHPADLVGKSWRCLYSHEELRRFEREVFPVLMQHHHWQGEAIANRKDGSTFIEGLSLTLTANGELICVCRDITAQKQAAAQLQHTNEQLILSNAELARATRLKDEFLANMSHELRTPLNAILGMAEGLQEEAFGPISMTQRRAIATIDRSGRHLLELINDILDLSKIESGKLELQMAPVSVTYLCESSLTFIRQQAARKNIHLIAPLPTSLPDLLGDELRIRQMLINLLDNAVKFTPEGGTVRFGVSACREDEGCFILFTIQDTGIGICPEDLKRLFHPFIQIDSSLTRQHAGTGLGLALVRQLAELHGGTATATSTVGQGSCFTVRLPYTRPPEAGKTSLPPTPDTFLPPPTATVLIIEDTPSATEQISRYLAELGLQAAACSRGQQALDTALQLQPALIILDLMLPDVSGTEVLTQLKSHPQTQPIPVLITSVLEEQSQALALGAFDYLVKPITRENFHQILSTIQLIPPLPPPAPLQSSLLSPLILLAEDNSANIATLSGYLSSRGFRLIVAEDGAEAIALTATEHPDLILMDVQMPTLDGLSAIRQLRADPATVSIPIIALTALAMPTDREKCLEAGANDYLTKPVRLKSLVEAMQRLLEETV